MVKRITIREIAERAGVTPSTVSRALNPAIPGKISDAVREKIVRLCDELHYRPNFTGRSIATGKTFKIGMILCDMQRDFTAHDWVRLSAGLSTYLQRHSYSLVVLHADDLRDKGNKQVCNFLMSGVADGYVTGPSMVTHAVHELLERLRVPFAVVCESGQSSDAACCVQRDDMDSFGAVWKAIPADCLDKIAFFCPGSLENSRRYREIIRAGEQAGFPAAKLLTPFFFQRESQAPAMEYRDAFNVAESLQDEFAGKKFFWCTSDFLAMGLVDSLNKHGREVGKDVFVVGYGDFENFPGMTRSAPELSTVSASAGLLGEQVGKLLLAQIAGKKTQTVVAKTTFIQRKSFPKR